MPRSDNEPPSGLGQPSPEMMAFERACGLIVRQWAALESMLWLYLMMFSGINDQFKARLIWATLPNMQTRRKLLNRLAETYLDDSALPAFRRLMTRVSKLGHKRNLIAHGLGGYYEGNTVVFFDDVDDKDGGFDFAGKEEYALTDVLHWPAAINNLSADLLKSYYDFLPLVHASAKMHREQPNDRDQHSDPHPEESTGEEPPPPPRSSQE